MNASAQMRLQAAADERPVALRAENVGTTFRTSNHLVEAIRKVDFELFERETLAIVGPSGCGKSALFNAIAGRLRATRGHVEVAGRRVDDATGHVGYMLQKDLLLPWPNMTMDIPYLFKV
jgi:NitT/TauT family transport system ATP-binding protein